MSDISVSKYMPCYTLDPTTGKAKLDKYDQTKFMQLLAEAEEEYRNTPLGTGTLTDQEIQALAKKYDPKHMSQSEYEQFISCLVDKNVLSAKETCNIGLRRVILRPGSYTQAQIVPNLSSNELSIRTLEDAKGDASYFVDLLLKWCSRSTEAGRIDAGALQKVSNILRQMESVSN